MSVVVRFLVGLAVGLRLNGVECVVAKLNTLKSPIAAIYECTRRQRSENRSRMSIFAFFRASVVLTVLTTDDAVRPRILHSALTMDPR